MKEYLLNCIDRTFDDEDYYKINKYIEDLEERIDKAIEYIESHSLYEEEYDYDYEENSYLSGIDDETATKNLLEILNKEVK